MPLLVDRMRSTKIFKVNRSQDNYNACFQLCICSRRSFGGAYEASNMHTIISIGCQKGLRFPCITYWSRRSFSGVYATSNMHTTINSGYQKGCNSLIISIGYYFYVHFSGRNSSFEQVATGLSYTVILTRQGQVYTCGSNSHGQLGHGDTLERPIPRKVERFNSLGPVFQIAAGVNHTMAVTEDGTLYSFGYGSNFCLGHGDPRDELQPRAVQAFKRKNIHVIRVSAGDEHSVALDSSGYVYTWGKGYCGALGHGDENDKTSPEMVAILQGHRAVQVFARKRKTFVLSDGGLVFAFGWMGFGSLGFVDRSNSDKVVSPRVLETLKGFHVSQISTGLYHTVAITNKGLIFGFGDNERAQHVSNQERLRWRM